MQIPIIAIAIFIIVDDRWGLALTDMGYIDGNDVQWEIYCRLMLWLHELMLSTISIGIDIDIGDNYHH
jgi:hypothetical protein